MVISGNRSVAAFRPLTSTAPKSQAEKAPADSVTVDFSGPRPAHRVVKKISRGAAALVGAAGAAKIGYDLVSGNLGSALASAALTSGAILGMDLASGLWHHHGDNYGKHPQSLKHVEWHTDTTASDYCLVGLSNRALDAVGFWPKYEKAVYDLTGQQPVAWQVAPYKDFCLGKIDEAQLHAEQARLGMPLGQP